MSDSTGLPILRLPPLRDVVATHDLNAKKALGQNFLFDLNLTGRIARQVPALRETTVIEVGPGPGGLTRGLLEEGAKKVIAIERDERCRPILADIAAAYPGRLDAHFGDAMQADYAALAGEGPIAICANLPYNIGTQLLIGWLTPKVWPPVWSSLTLMFQKEVAERIVATPGSKAYGRLSVLAHWRCRVASVLFDVGPGSFVPPPKVTSSIIQLLPNPNPAPVDPARLEEVVARAFGQRRKMLRAALKGIGPLDQLFEAAGLKGTERAEELSPDTFILLANALTKARQASAPAS